MFKVGQKVTFGKHNQFDGVVVRVNKKTLRVEITRSENPTRKVGSVESLNIAYFKKGAFKAKGVKAPTPTTNEERTMQRMANFERGVATQWQADFDKTMSKFFK